MFGCVIFWLLHFQVKGLGSTSCIPCLVWHLAHQILALLFPEPGLNTTHCNINKSIIQCLIQMKTTMERLKSTLPYYPFTMLVVMFGLHQDHHIIIIMLTCHKTSKKGLHISECCHKFIRKCPWHEKLVDISKDAYHSHQSARKYKSTQVSLQPCSLLGTILK